MNDSRPACPQCGHALNASDKLCPSCALAFDAVTVTGSQESNGSSEVDSRTTFLRPGLVLCSRYAIERRLGRGGMGTVYKAHDCILGEPVAVKLLRPDRLADAAIRERFKSEIRLARKVRHPNVCSIYEFGEAPEGPFISMELIEGSNLWQILRSGPLSTRQAFDLTIQVAEGLQAVHDVGIVHRDLKSSNLMLDAAGRVRLMDFGIAAREDGDAVLETTIVGTPAYMSPEQAQGRKVGPRSDVYALGLVIFEMFTGRLPARAAEPPITGSAPAPVELPLDDPRIPDPVRPILERTLAAEPWARYATAQAVAKALRAAWVEEAPQPRIGTAPAAVRPALRVTLALGAAFLAAATAAVVLRVRSEGDAPRPASATGSASPAALLVVVRPWGELEIDGKPAGTTPLDWLTVPSGRHRVRVRHPTWGAWEEPLTLVPGERRRLVIDLRSRPSRSP